MSKLIFFWSYAYLIFSLFPFFPLYFQVGGKWQGDAVFLLREILLNRCVDIQVMVSYTWIYTKMVVLHTNCSESGDIGYKSVCVCGRSFQLTQGDPSQLSSSLMGWASAGSSVTTNTPPWTWLSQHRRSKFWIVLVSVSQDQACLP